MNAPLLSIIVPVRDRPLEISRLLKSMGRERPIPESWELIIVEDGSVRPAHDAVESNAGIIPVRYFSIPPSGRSFARNFGADRALGEYLLFIDSDCQLPRQFIRSVRSYLLRERPLYWGGPDRTHPSCSRTQKAIGFAMNSFLTTGGVRNGLYKFSRYHPRGMNLGIQAELFKRVGGFKPILGEDIELGIRLKAMGFLARYVPELFVYHEPRTNFSKFLNKTFEAGFSKSTVFSAQRGSLQWVYFAPILVVLAFFLLPFRWIFAGSSLFSLALFCSAQLQTRSFLIALLVIPAALIQIVGYAVGVTAGFFLHFLFMIAPGRRVSLKCLANYE